MQTQSIIKTALVTGAGRRIGNAIARDLATDGWAIAIHCHTSHAEAQTLATEIKQAGGKAAVVIADLADLGNIDRLMAESNDALGPINLLINSASMFEPDDIGELDMALWRQQLDVNLSAPVLLADAFVRQLPNAGNIINILDQRVWRLTPKFTSYTIAKSALWTATQTMAQALAPKIRVNAIGPGPALPNTRQSQGDFDAQTAHLLLGKGPQLWEFTAAIKFLVAMPSITGQMIALDGGQHLAWQTPDVTGMME